MNEGTVRASSGEWSESSSRAARGALTHTRVWRERVQLRERTKSELGSVSAAARTLHMGEATLEVSATLLSGLRLYKILFYFEAFVHESIILSLPTPTCTARTIAIRLHVDCAIYDVPPDPPFVSHTPYNIGNGNIVQTPSHAPFGPGTLPYLCFLGLARYIHTYVSSRLHISLATPLAQTPCPYFDKHHRPARC